MEPEGSLPCSQKSATEPSLERNEHIRFPLPSWFRRIRSIPRPCVTFCNRLFFTKSYYASHNTKAGGPPIVGCPRLLIQYNRSYPPYLETVSSIPGRAMLW
jgi:hypothetical protein